MQGWEAERPHACPGEPLAHITVGTSQPLLAMVPPEGLGEFTFPAGGQNTLRN